MTESKATGRECGSINQPQVDVDGLRRSGRMSIWPYMMRDLPLSPIEALRFEMRSQMAGQPSTHAVGSNGGSLSKHTNVQFVLARLTDGRNQRETTAFCVPEQQQQQHQHRPRADSDIDALYAGLAEVHKRQHDILTDLTLTSSPNCWRQQSPVDMENRHARSTGSSPDRRTKSQSRRRPASSGARRPPDSGPEGRPIDLFAPRPAGDRTECPLGCGEEVRLHNLVRHQASQCTSRYIDCLMPGCGAIVSACKMSVHLKRECPIRKKQHDLAAKAAASELQERCDACGSLVSRKTLRAHRANECGMRLVHCSRLGCTQKVVAKSIADHERKDCAIARHNTALIEQGARRSATEECPQCHAVVPTAMLRKHAAVECSMRIVACPNKSLGCAEKLRAAKVTLHLREECFVQHDRWERASRFAERRERVRCSGCGYTVVAQHLATHQRYKCPNRKVPCKHWELGCPVMLRLSAMDEHLKVDRLLIPRSCLVFDGGRAYIALDGKDRKPPWTVEMWIWRPGLVESIREKARTALQAYWEFQQSRVKLKVAEQRLSMLEPLLAAATNGSKERSRETEGARDKLMDEVVDAATLRDDAKVELVVASVVLSNSLAAATRGVEEITAQDRLRGCDRLTLASTPWYAVPSDSRKGKKIGSGRGEHAKGENTTVKQTRTLPSSGASSQLSQQPSGLTAGNIEKGDSHHQLSNPDSGNIDEGTTSSALEAVAAGTATELVDRGSETSPKGAIADSPAGVVPRSDVCSNDGHEDAVGKEAEVAGEALAGAGEAQPPLGALKEANERALAQKEASFWAEWVALSGRSLAKSLLHLSGETLPLLKEEVVALTGVSADAIFHGASNSNDNAAGEEMRSDDGFATPDNDDSSASTKKSSHKSATKKAARKAKRKQKHEQKFGQKLESRIAEEVGKRGGVETLFGSDKALFQLEMGAQDRVGIKVTGQPDQPFNYRCPRQRWVHLAFVSDSSGVFLLENGKTASRAHDVTVALPMREIGGRETACQCLVHEVRYWKVKRSKDELEGWMHEVLPTTAVMEGLLGYWTFEEGAGEYVNDMTEQHIRARMVGRGLKWVTPELMCTFQVGEAPTPSWREQNVCKVELRRGRLADRGRLHREFVHCPSGCGESFLQTNTRAHLAYRCKLREVSCSMAACGKRVVANDLARHLREDCASHAAWLRMAKAGEENRESCACPHCSETVRRCNLKVHIKYVCQWTKDPCRNPGCGASIPRVRLVEHERRFCGASNAIRRRRRLARARARSKYYRGWAQDD